MRKTFHRLLALALSGLLVFPAPACEPTEKQTPVTVKDGSPAKEKIVAVDRCIAEIITQLQTTNITTLASCCGHGKQDGFVLLGKWDGKRYVPHRRISVSREMTERETMTHYWQEWDGVSKKAEQDRRIANEK